jgi:hypothetical protein
MTITSSTARVNYSGNSSTQDFSVPFKFFENDHLTVVVRSSTGVDTVKVLTTDYTVTGAGSPFGGQVSMLTAPATGETLIIYRNVPITQIIDYIANDPFPAESHEAALDKLTMIAQQQQVSLDRAIKFPDSDGDSISGVLPAASVRASKYLSFDSSGNVSIASGTTSPFPVSVYMEDVVAAADAAAARTLLDAQQYDVDTAKTDVTQEFTAAQQFAQTTSTVTAVAALNIDCSAGDYFTKTINGNSTFTVSNVPSSKAYGFTLELVHTSGTITWFANVKWSNGVAPSLTTGRTHLFFFATSNGGSTWYGAALPNYTV